jgi:FixJ family two-component response regulator
MHGAPDDSARLTVTLVPAPSAEITSVLLRLHGLSAREREVAELLMLGPATDEIAARLHISHHTLRDHTKSIFRQGRRPQPLTVDGARIRSHLTEPGGARAGASSGS